MDRHHPSARLTGERPTASWFVVAGLCAAAATAGVGCRAQEADQPEPDGPAIEQTLRWTQPAGTEIVKCHTFKLPTDVPVNVRRVQFRFGTGSHHVHIYRSNTPEDQDAVTDCESGLSWPRWEMMVGAQTEPLDWQLPDGLTVPVDAHQQMLVQVHWLNPTKEQINGEITLRFSTAEDPGTAVGTLFGINKRIALAPGERRVFTQSCPLPAGTNLLAMMGHFHALGRRYTANLVTPDGASQPIYNAADEGTLELESFDPPLATRPGSALEFSCDMFNRRTVEARWGADTMRDEHCNVVAYYYPASDAASACIREFASTGTVAGVDLPADAPWAGDTFPVNVRLGAAGADDTLVEIRSNDASAVAAPPFAVIPAGQLSATVTARALRPTRTVGIEASLFGTRATTSVAVRGLVLSEVMAWPVAGGTGTWIEIANLGTTPVDLARYGVALGGASVGGGYQAAGAMSGILSPLGCVVLPVALGAGSGGGDGVALVEMMGSDAMPTSPPLGLDVLVYGDGNRYALQDAYGKVATPVAAMGPGQSINRRDMNTWRGQLVPTPAVCEVLP